MTLDPYGFVVIILIFGAIGFFCGLLAGRKGAIITVDRTGPTYQSKAKSSGMNSHATSGDKR